MTAKNIIMIIAGATLTTLAILAIKDQYQIHKELEKKKQTIISILNPDQYSGPFQECVKSLINGSTDDISLLYNFALSKKTMDIHIKERQNILFSGESVSEIAKSVVRNSKKISKTELEFHKSTSLDMIKRCKI